MQTLPPNIVNQAHSLNPDELISLLKIEIFPVNGDPSIFLYLSERDDVVFDGKTYTSSTYTLMGAGIDSGGEKVRPRLQMANPQGMFSVFAQSGDLEMARVDRFRVHPLDVNTSSAQKNSWYVSRIEVINSSMIIFELAALTDGAKVKIPYRTYTVPEFRSVSL